MRLLPRILTLLLLANTLLAQSGELDVLWEKKFGYGFRDRAHDIIQTYDGEVVMVGEANPPGYSGKDFLLVHSRNGLKHFVQTTKGRLGDEIAYGVVQTRNGALAIVGSSDSDGNSYKEDTDGFFILTDENGTEILRDTLLGSTSDDAFYDITTDRNGDLLIAGERKGQIWLVKMTIDGVVLWEKTFPAKGQEKANSLLYTDQDHILLVGETYDKDKDRSRVVLLQTDANGQLLQRKLYGDGQPSRLVSNGSDGYTVVGTTRGRSRRDNAVVIHLDQSLEKISEREYGGRGHDGFLDVGFYGNGAPVYVGYNSSYKRGVARNKAWIFEPDAKGEVQDEALIGGIYEDVFQRILHLDDGRLLIAGYSASNDAKSEDAWLVMIQGTKTPGQEDGAVLDFGKIQFVDANGNEILEPKERSYLAVTIQNSGIADVYQSEVIISATNKRIPGLNIPDRVKVGRIKTGATKRVQIPVTGGNNLEKGRATLRLSLEAVSVVFAQSEELSIETTAPKVARLEIVRHSYSQDQGPFYRGQPVTLEVWVKNTGDRTAESGSISFYLPDQVNALAKQEVPFPRLASAEEVPILFTFEASPVFQEDSMEIKCSLAAAGQETMLQRFAIPLAIEKPEQVVVQELQFTRVEWVRPRYSKERQERYAVTDNQQHIEVIGISTQPLNESHFTVFLNGKPYGQGSKMGRVKLYVNKDRENSFGAENTFSASLEVDIDLQLGENEVYVSVENEAGKDQTVPITFVYNPMRPNLHVLAIGVDHIDLEFPSKDASDFAAAFDGQQGKLFEKIFVTTYTSLPETTTSSLRKAIIRLKNQYEWGVISPEDVVLVYISTHGRDVSSGDQKNLQLLASDHDPLYLNATSLNYTNDVAEPLSNIGCSKLVFLDACKSGTVFGYVRGRKSGAPKKNLGEAIQDIIEADKRIRTLTSCKANEFSYENPKWQNGAFTEAILEAFENQPERISRKETAIANTNKDEILTLGELYEFIKKRVPYLVATDMEEVQDSQNPVISDTDFQADMPIYYLGQ